MCRRLQARFLLGLLLSQTCTAFQIHRTATSHRHRIHHASDTSLHASTMFPGGGMFPGSNREGSSPFDVSSGLIAQLAVMALKLRLARQTDVSCDVISNPFDLMRGRVGPVTVSGQGWASAKGLTCRSLEAQVESCELDVQKVFTDQKLRLTVPAEGKAVITLNAQDFSNFITHPLMAPPKAKGDEQQDGAITFIKEGTRIEPSNGGSVHFHSDYNGQRWKCMLKGTDKNGQRASIGVAPLDKPLDDSWKPAARLLSQSLSEFFNKMVFELDGTYLSFRDMSVATDVASDPSVTLFLDIRVKKFPSKGLDF
ncbi:hypothetical protein MPSEU_000248100 [Mayamaea pseudoterrestris]|nr:hypothetical protein MPSEU_000248100 [Mayamaea pseudoterrestris]